MAVRLLRALWSGLMVAVLAACPARVAAQTAAGCPGCVLRLPRAAGDRPLVVALHGDGATPGPLVALLQGEAERRGVILFAPLCPRALGCPGASWWRWAGASAWLTRQIERVVRSQPVDARRVYGLGWSGGASYLASSLDELPATFAAVGLVGGGMPGRGGCPSWAAPVYFVSGARNPLRALAEAGRERLASCGHSVRWVSLPQADHEGEWRALREREAARILAFFLAQARPLAPGAAVLDR